LIWVGTEGWTKFRQIDKTHTNLMDSKICNTKFIVKSMLVSLKS
jgi:hypothetical protein